MDRRKNTTKTIGEATLYSKLVSALGKDHSQRYKGAEGKKRIDFERMLKKKWNAQVDRNFIQSVKLVHWLMSGDPTKFLTTPRNNEISAEGYLPDEPLVSNFTNTQVGVLLDGYVTFAMKSGGATGFFGGKDTPEGWKSSGTVKRAPEYKANRVGQPILNKDSEFRTKGTYNEFIVDNWKPVALVAKGGIDNPFYKELYNYSRENDLPIVDENGNQIESQDPAQFSLGKKITTGAKRMAQGALPVEEGKTMKQLFENWRKYINENEYEPGRAVADIDTGEEHLSPAEVAEEDVRDLAAKFNVEAFVETASDGNTAILVFHQNGEPRAYNDTEEMYQDLASRQETDIGDL